MKKTILLSAGLIGLFALSGCTIFRVGPDYTESTFARSEAVTNALHAAEVTNTLAIATWWDTFNDPQLTALVKQALSTNRELRIAEAKIRQARAQLGIAAARFLPGLNFAGEYQRQGVSQNSMNFPMGNLDQNYYSAGFDATWELDIFGGNWRQLEASMASLQAIAAMREAVKVTLAAEVVTGYISFRTAQQRLLVAQNNVAIQSNTYALVASRAQSGLENQLPIQQSIYNLEKTRADIPAIESALESSANALAILTGEMPGTLHEQLAAPKGIPEAPAWLLEGIPAEVIRFRPDVRAAERQAAAAMAEIGMARADYYPKFALNGAIGLQSLKAPNFFEYDSMAYGFGPKVSWAIFRGGSIRNNVLAKTAAQEQALLAYEQTVLAAAKEIRDALVAYNKEMEREASLRKAVDAAKKAVTISEDLYKNGLTDFNNVLDAQRSLSALEEGEIASKGNISAQLVRLYKALGGGWQPVPAEAAPAPAAPDNK